MRIMDRFIFWCLKRLAILTVKYTKHPKGMFQMGASVVVKGERYPFIFESNALESRCGIKEFIEKLIARLEGEQKEAQSEGSLSFAMGFKSAKLIVNELAEEYKPKTNADKIRSMSDEELADYIIFVGYDYTEKIPCCKNTPQCTEILDDGRIIPNEMCRGCLIKWLKSKTE